MIDELFFNTLVIIAIMLRFVFCVVADRREGQFLIKLFLAHAFVAGTLLTLAPPVARGLIVIALLWPPISEWLHERYKVNRVREEWRDVTDTRPTAAKCNDASPG